MDWNFDPVPDPELVACCYWEYARESPFIRETLHQYRDWFRAGGNRNAGGWQACCDLERIQSLEHVSEIVVRGCALDSHPRPHSELTGNFPAPWQSLSPAERKARSQFHTARQTGPLVPFRRGDWQDARALARRENFAAAEARQSPALPPSFCGAGGAEVTVVAIAWPAFTNEELVRYFRRWTKANRPKHLPQPDARGHKTQDWRAQLTRLAVLRLLAHFTALELVSDDRLPEIWQSRQFSGRQWGDVSKWYEARRLARRTFQNLFPFQPASQLPLSWQRTASAK